MSGKIGRNPLDRLRERGSGGSIIDDIPIEKEKIIKEYGRLVNMTPSLMEKIDFSDTLFINRIAIEVEDLELDELKESIEKVGLMNIIYLQEKDDGNYRIVSGLRRSKAVELLFKEKKSVKTKDRVVVLDKETPYEYLDIMSVDENLKRKDLTILEQSYKFNREASKKEKSIEDILKEYNISKKSFYRIKNAINYADEVREIIEEIGPDKAELLNKIILKEKKRKSPSEIVKEFRNLNRDELRDLLKKLSSNEKSSGDVELKSSSKSIKLIVNKKVPTDVRIYLEKIAKLMDKGDYSFIK